MDSESRLLEALPYRRLEQGRDYWIFDDVLPNPQPVTERCWAKSFWTLGAPFRPEYWPGMRSPEALLPGELATLESKVALGIGADGLWRDVSPVGQLCHNFVQLVGGGDSDAKPHVDSLALCDFAAVLYLHPYPPTKHAGTSFYRLRLPDGRRGGNRVAPPHTNLVDALGVKKLPITAWEEVLEVPYVYNRLLVYRSDLVHSATAYFGDVHLRKRMSAVFFWKKAGFDRAATS
jgi:hypothetical protein